MDYDNNSSEEVQSRKMQRKTESDQGEQENSRNKNARDDEMASGKTARTGSFHRMQRPGLHGCFGEQRTLLIACMVKVSAPES